MEGGGGVSNNSKSWITNPKSVLRFDPSSLLRGSIIIKRKWCTGNAKGERKSTYLE